VTSPTQPGQHHGTADEVSPGPEQPSRSYTWLVLLVFGVVVFGSAFFVFFVVR
jgi:hypothetical protein